MPYREIWHEIHINAAPSEVYQAITDVKKMAHWWTTDTRGESAIGNKLEFWFYGRLSAEMVVTTLKVDELVRWRVGREVTHETGSDFALFSLDKIDAQHIRQALEMAGGKINGPGGAAQILGLHPNTLRSRMNKLGIPYGRRRWRPG
jgi:Bacterial regulatory protein, Fis family